ncbi:hypothetical protein [Pseudomonas syringae]|uniref:Uncharacterized protein n=1 Tax=Pseudomonas syringae CC1417 TaxID=1357272 RepID=A0AAU8LP85_PSESX
MDPNRAAPMLGKAECGKSYTDVAFLTRDDRKLLGDVYEWASGQGADLGYVDDLGIRLARYREKDDGRISAPHNQGTTYDSEGHKVYYRFTDKDAATAKCILESEALNTTRLDRGFVRYITDKDYGSMYHNDFEFMEQVIKRFSSLGGESQALMPGFARHEYPDNNFVMTRSKEKYAVGKHNVQDEQGANSALKKSTKPIPITLESLRADLRQALFKAMGVKSFSSLFALLFKDKR